MTSFNENLVESISNKKSFLVVGLDPSLEKMPIKNIFEFNKEIIDNTYDLVVGYKPQLAYYESNGFSGLEALYKTVDYIKNLPEKKIITSAHRAQRPPGTASQGPVVFLAHDRRGRPPMVFLAHDDGTW